MDVLFGRFPGSIASVLFACPPLLALLLFYLHWVWFFWSWERKGFSMVCADNNLLYFPIFPAFLHFACAYLFLPHPRRMVLFTIRPSIFTANTCCYPSQRAAGWRFGVAPRVTWHTHVSPGKQRFGIGDAAFLYRGFKLQATCLFCGDISALHGTILASLMDVELALWFVPVSWLLRTGRTCRRGRTTANKGRFHCPPHGNAAGVSADGRLYFHHGARQ